MTEDIKKPSLFETLFTMTDEDAKKSKLPLVEKKIKRQLSAAFDDAEGRIIEAQEVKMKCMRDVENFDINAVLTANQKIRVAMDIQYEIKELYKEYFGTEFQG